jgi:glutamyl-tRNA synthetase
MDMPMPPASALIGKKMDAASSLAALRRVLATLESVPEWTERVMEPPMRALTEELGLKTGQLFGIVRIAVTGRQVAPPLFGTMVILGREKVMERLRAAESQLASEV